MLDPFRRLPFYRPARDLYHQLARPELAAEKQRMRTMLGEFVGEGSLVFDVGANHGVYAEVFEMLGARVAAIEPNSGLISFIRPRAPHATIVQAGSRRQTWRDRLMAGSRR